MHLKTTLRIWLARIFIGAVLIINLESALIFLMYPGRFAPIYELAGIPGQAAIQGFAILFLMWNVPYAVALINPIKYRVSHIEAIIMQCIGLLGESLIYKSLPLSYPILRNSILRFIIFDAAGLIALIFAAWFTTNISAVESQLTFKKQG